MRFGKIGLECSDLEARRRGPTLICRRIDGERDSEEREREREQEREVGWSLIVCHCHFSKSVAHEQALQRSAQIGREKEGYEEACASSPSQPPEAIWGAETSHGKAVDRRPRPRDLLPLPLRDPQSDWPIRPRIRARCRRAMGICCNWWLEAIICSSIQMAPSS